MKPIVQEVAKEISEHLAEIEGLFKPGVKLTLLARRPEAPNGDQDMLLTNDDLRKVAEAVRLRIGAAAKGE